MWTYYFKYQISLFFGTLFFLSICQPALGQRLHDERPTTENFKGIQYTGDDSTFYINFRFRMQNRLIYTSNSSTDFRIRDIEARIRRLRLRMDGYLYSTKIDYTIQLGFTRGDQDYDATDLANIVRDAAVFYTFNNRFYISFGQSKLPGNRQRVNSSGELQFAERSLLNARFNIDRDFGIKIYHSFLIRKIPFHFKWAVSTGEGRVSNSTDNGLAYTARGEVLPFGEFTNGGDYLEGDLEHEGRVKLSIGGGYSFNDRTTRSGGQTGTFITSPITLKTSFLDLILKYRGWAYQLEYMKRDTNNPFSTSKEGRFSYAYKGSGVNQQLSYILNRKTGYELAGRYTRIVPHQDITNFESRIDVAEIGLTKYFRAHRFKLQISTHYQISGGVYRMGNKNNNWGASFQIELGI